ncbi:MAG: AAA-like domain-containing protein [Bacteroidetes bacterium]|nr:AAA-like domain-containing protein [Bacteroidota bacterium]
MKKYFNIAGPCNNKSHYMIPVLKRIKEIENLVEYGQYFVIHAPRQTGKTTLVKELVNFYNVEGHYYALYCSVESVQTFTEPKEGIPEILNNLKFSIRNSNLPMKELFAENADTTEISTLIKSSLASYCSMLDKPLIIFFDEIDGLQNGTLITFLRQIRDGYITRPEIPFVHSIALVGMRNVKDYKSKLRDNKQTLGSASPFNFITEALTVKNFSISEIEDLYAQHTQATGQVFDKQVIEKIFEQTEGQPWLVNAIAREVIQKILTNDYTQKITTELVEQAIQNIILRRDTHIDSLLDKLKEPRVQKIIEPIISGAENEINILDDDARYCLDLGLIKDSNRILQPANKIYGEVIIRTLSYNTQYQLYSQIPNRWIDNAGAIDMTGLLKGFQQFWRENSNIWIEKYDYKEAAPHLILQAFLQRIINGGGIILREYAAGRERMDLCVVYQNNKYPLELKIMYSKSVVQQGIEQLSAYMATLGEKTGWLVIFDRSNTKSWDEKTYWRDENIGEKIIHIVGC